MEIVMKLENHNMKTWYTTVLHYFNSGVVREYIREVGNTTFISMVETVVERASQIHFWYFIFSFRGFLFSIIEKNELVLNAAQCEVDSPSLLTSGWHRMSTWHITPCWFYRPLPLGCQWPDICDMSVEVVKSSIKALLSTNSLLSPTFEL